VANKLNKPRNSQDCYQTPTASILAVKKHKGEIVMKKFISIQLVFFGLAQPSFAVALCRKCTGTAQVTSEVLYYNDSISECACHRYDACGANTGNWTTQAAGCGSLQYCQYDCSVECNK
jgi:hypothetical protein